MLLFISIISFFLIIITYFVFKSDKYQPYSLCDSFTGLTKYKEIKDVCNIDCNIHTKFHFANKSGGTCKMSYNISTYHNNVIYAVKNIHISEYKYIHDKYYRKIKYLSVLFKYNI